MCAINLKWHDKKRVNARTKQKKKPDTMPRLTDSSAVVLTDIEDTKSECDSVAMEEEEISEPIQSEDQKKCKEIQEISRALANATGSQMHYENCIALATKFPNSNFEENLEINKMEPEKAKAKTREIQGKVSLIYFYRVQCKTVPPTLK
ncbi:hypothetical protein NPIL_412961 [Nephila pilipes]|uniref:Uncharacterized protein n=1 Tax=Nephila pilipes TaxID=299642 RepID=A0A8X6N5W6_NEPPI|nr:hypothetical protein NPIL_412961 [Nephila pilipes]